MGNDIRLSRDCELLTLDIESATGEHIGVNTMKRLLGFITDERMPRTSTLDVIAHYLGFAHWEELIEIEDNGNSDFNGSDDEIRSADLQVGCKVEITYLPDRQVVFSYLGGNRYRVVQSLNSKLLAGDQLTLTHIVRGYPLLVAEVIRDGQNLGAFTAGKAQGIDFDLL